MDKLLSPALPVAILGAWLSSSPPALAAMESCEFSAERTANLDAAGVTKVVIAAGAGDLTIRGVEGSSNVRATGHACAARQPLLDKTQLESRRDGNTLYLHTALPEGRVLVGFDSYARIDLEVILPATVAIEVEDGSGDLEISGTGPLSIEDSSGDIKARGTRGDIHVSDSSGDIQIEHITGNVEIVRDSSGDMEIEDVQGSVEVLVDSSGGMDIERVTGSVRVRQDSSGDILISETRGDATVDSDSSGDIRADRIGGNFIVKADTSGDITHDRIAGSVQLPPNKD